MTEEIIGKEIVEIRQMTEQEQEEEGWSQVFGDAPAIVLEGGQVLYPSADPEGNGPGALFGFDHENEETFWVPTPKEE